MTNRVAAHLARRFTLGLPDLRGYGDSDQPAGVPDRSNSGERALARDVLEIMLVG